MLIVYGDVPPPKVAVTEPSAPLLQVASVLVRLSVTAVGSLTVIEVVFEQPPLSVTVTLCDPALRPLKVFGDVAVAAAPPSMLIEYGEVPPLKVAVTVPSEPPLQETSVSVRLNVTSLTVTVWLQLTPGDGQFAQVIVAVIV